MNNDFDIALNLWGPTSCYAPVSLQQAQAYCRRLAHAHYENFSVASLFLPRRLLPHFHAIYGYCRWADDLGDETGGGERALALLQWWREELARCYESVPRHPVMVALQRTIRRFHIPPEPFLDLISAFEQDQHVKRYQTFAQVVDYCRCSANPVGRLVLYLCECFDPSKAALADAVCTGLQLANFWQDVRRDLDIGRVYLPAEDLRRFGYAEADLEERRFTPAFRELMRFEVERARSLFHQGMPLVRLVPRDVQADIELFIRGGLGILDKIVAIDYDVWGRRPVLGKWDKAALVGGVLWRRAQEWAWGDDALVTWPGGKLDRHVGNVPPQNSLARSYRFCEALARREAGNFYPAFRVLPRQQRLSMCALYTFMRIADDLSDEPGPVEEKRTKIALWRQGLEAATRGDFRYQSHEALADTIERYAIPLAYLEAVLDGVEMDLEPVRYETFADLQTYCYRVASAVGLACIHIWGFAQPRAKVYAEQAGLAFQLTNILRDLGEDAARGRVYLPHEDLDRFGYHEDKLRRGQRDDAFDALMRFEVARARALYDGSWKLLPLLSAPGRAVFLVMAKTYRGLLDAIEAAHYDVFTSRARVRKWRKLWFFLQALPARWDLV